MNGFTSSLHIKGATAKRVQQTVTDLLQAEGFHVLPADDDSTDEGQQQITRGVWVAKTRGDWVSVFCSDFMFQQEIGRELSKKLKTHTLNVWVTEGSAWHYSLFSNGEEVDQFDSSGGDDDLADFLDQGLEEISDEGADDGLDDDDEIAEISGEDDEASPIQEGLSRIAELQEQIAEKMPGDVKEIYDRLNEGKASLSDMRRFDQWSQANQAELARFQDQLQQQTAALTATMQGVFQQGLPGDADDADPAAMLQGMLPPDIAEVFSKLLTGQASPEEIQRFANDMGGEIGADELDADLVDMTDEDDDEIPEATFNDDDEEEEDDDLGEDGMSPGLSEEQLQIHLGALQPLLEKDVDQDELAETLTTQDDAPEEPLSDFLSMLGIGGTLATMDFDLIEQTSEEDLEEAGIELGPLLLVRSS
jgi:hypothetical protein